MPFRQWVLAFPHRVRFVLARRPGLLSAALTFFVRALFSFQRRRAWALRLPTTRAGTSGAVTFVQRFGSALQLTLHFHTLLPDGVFIQETTGDGDRLRFVKLEPPEEADVERVIRRVVRRVDKLLVEHGVAGSPDEPGADEPTDVLSKTLSRSMTPPPRTRPGRAPLFPPALRPRTARDQGFSLHADVAVHENDRQGLERLCRYGLRPALSLARLSRAEDGRLRYRMKRTFSDGTSELLLSSSELLRRLCAVIPPPRVHVTRYHGVFAPHARVRRAVTKQGPSRRSRRRRQTVPLATVAMDAPATDLPGTGTETVPAGAPSSLAPAAGVPWDPRGFEPPDSPHRARYLPWAELLRRVHEVEVLRCSRCPGRRRVIAFITNAEVVTAILAHLGVSTPAAAPCSRPSAPTGRPSVSRLARCRLHRSASSRPCLIWVRSQPAGFHLGRDFPCPRPDPSAGSREPANAFPYCHTSLWPSNISRSAAPGSNTCAAAQFETPIRSR